MKACRRVGFAASGVIHLLLFGLFLLPKEAAVKSAPVEETLAVTLDMFELPAPPVVAMVPVEPPPLPQTEPPAVVEQTVAEPEIVASPPAEPKAVSPEPKVAPKPEPERQVKARPKPKLKPKPKPQRKPATPAPTVVAEVDPLPSPKVPLVAAAAPQRDKRVAQHSTRLASLRDRYLADLVRRLNKGKFYPRAAKRRGEEGSVVVRFVIASDGQLRDLSVVESSGYRRLDEAAITTLERLSPVPAIPEELDREAWPIMVPIAFSLRR